MKIPVHQINLKQPPIGNKMFCAQQHAYYVLEKGPTTLRALANTHMGSGSIVIYDGVPDENGFFPDNVQKHTLADFEGRIVFNANPPVMGMWMFDGGLHYGCTLALLPGTAGVSPCVAITWMPAQPVKRTIVDVNDDKPRRK